MGYEPVTYPTLDLYLFRPVIAGLWKHHEALDGTYTFADLMDAHEMLDVKEANRALHDDWMAKKERAE